MKYKNRICGYKGIGNAQPSLLLDGEELRLLDEWHTLSVFLFVEGCVSHRRRCV